MSDGALTPFVVCDAYSYFCR